LAASGGATTATVASTSGYPSPPFIVGLERGTDNQEVGLCTGTTGTTFTLVRGYDGTSPLLHDIGATIEHTSAAIDYREANAFVNLLTTLGDIIVYGPSGNARLPIGPDGTSLTADSSQTNGLAWEQTIAPGIVAATATSGAPAGWLKCQGQAVSRATYTNLWNALGTTSSPWGQGDGSTTFNVPNLQGVVIIGVGTNATHSLTARALAAYYGEENHTLVLSETPVHNHPFSANTGTESVGHTHASVNGYEPIVQASGSFGRVVGGTNDAQAATGATTSDISNTHTHSLFGTTGNAGSGGGHNTLQPSVGLNYVIKT
jgi:microcystin-dependent protein